MGLTSARIDGQTGTATPADAAFEALFLAHYPRLRRILSGLLGPAEADDAAQEVFLRLYRSSLPAGESPRIGAWLNRVAVNTAYNLLRSRRRQAARLERAGRLDQGETPLREAELNPAAALAASEEAALVRAALEALPETQRAVLVLRGAGLSYAEVAQAAGVKTNSVGALLARGEARLRRRYFELAGARPAELADDQPAPDQPSPRRQP